MLAAQGKTLAAYTAVPGPSFSGLVARGLIADEGPYAKQVAALYPNVRHRLVDSTGSDMLRELERIFPLLDLPTPGALNQVWADVIADRAAASGAKVLLCGALGNFTISYAGNELPRATFRSGHWLRAIQQARQLRRIGLSSGRNAASLTVFAALPWAIRFRVDPLIRAVTLEGIAIDPERAKGLDLLDRARRQFFECNTHLPHVMEQSFHNNQYGDHNAACSAGWGMDTRDPTADKRVYEFCAAIPPEQFVVGGRGRSLIRRAMRGRLPATVLDSREKGTQAADWYESLSAIQPQLSTELKALAKSPGARRLLDLERLRSAVDHWPQTAREAFEQAGLYEATLPRAISVGYFIRRCEAEARASAITHSPTPPTPDAGRPSLYSGRRVASAGRGRMSLLAKVARHRPADRLLAAEALFWLALFRFCLAVVPVRTILRTITRERPPAKAAPETLPNQPDAVPGSVLSVRWAVEVVARNSPVAFVCFPQTLAGYMMLRLRDVRTTMVYGAARSAQGELIAHTWLTIDGRIIIGGEGTEAFSPIERWT